MYKIWGGIVFLLLMQSTYATLADNQTGTLDSANEYIGLLDNTDKLQYLAPYSYELITPYDITSDIITQLTRHSFHYNHSQMFFLNHSKLQTNTQFINKDNNMNATVIPEPTSLGLLGILLITLGFIRRRKKDD